MNYSQSGQVEFANHSASLILIAILFCLLSVFNDQSLSAQSITRMPAWVQHDDPFAVDNKTAPTTSAAIVGVPGARVTLTMTCRAYGYRTNLDILADINKAVTKYPSTITISGSITGASLDVVEAKEYFGWDGNRVPGYINSKFRLDSGDGLTGPFDAPDSHHFVAKPPAGLSVIAKSKAILLGFAVNGQDIALQLPMSQPLVTQYISACLRTDPNYIPDLTPAQKAAAAAAEEERQKKAKADAEAKATAEKEERERIVAEEAARQQRRSVALSVAFSQPDGPVNPNELVAVLLGKTLVPTVDIGSTGPNPQGKDVPITTKIFPDGSEAFILGTGSWAVDRAPQYHTYNKGLDFKVTKAAPKFNQIELQLTANLDAGFSAEVRIVIDGTGDKSWQKSLTNRKAMDAIEKFLRIQW